MHAFEPPRVDEDFDPRQRQRHGVDLAAVEFYGDDLLGLATGIELEIVGAQRRLHRVDETAQDPILIEAFHAGKRGFDAARYGRLSRYPRGRREIAMGVEAQMEEFD